MRNHHFFILKNKLSFFLNVFFIFFLFQSQALAEELLLNEKRLKAADDYYSHSLLVEANTSFSTLEKLEHKVNAKQAIDNKDWYGARYSFARVVSVDPKDFHAWFLLARVFIELKAINTHQNYQEGLDCALTKAYQLAPSELDKAAVLWMAYRFVEDAQYNNQDLRKAALTLRDVTQIEARIQDLLAQYPTVFSPYYIDIPQRTDIGSACISWTYPLVKNRAFQYEDYVNLTPKVKDLAVIARGNKLCLEGLQFGNNYQLSFKKGFAGEGVKLEKEESLKFYVPHRKPTIRFRERGYILPAHGPQMIPFVAVNVDKVELKIVHIPERNIPSVQANWFSNQVPIWAMGQLKEEYGEVVWQGIYHSKGEMDKTAISGLPIDEILGKKLQPGVYVIEARVNEKSYEQDEFATQALVISDIGLSTYKGKDGLHVYARSLHLAKPLAGVEVSLIARNNRELAKAKTTVNGLVSFDKAILNGQGGNVPAFLTASFKGQQFTVLNLRNEAFDLASHGAAGRAFQGAIEGYLTSERGIYRPGETVHFVSLLRDDKGQAATKLPLTLRLYRPDGVLAHETLLEDKGIGGYAFDFQLSGTSQTGTWMASIFVDPKGAEIGHSAFEIQDFVPPQIEVKTSSHQEKMVPHENNTVSVSAQYFFGSSGANLTVEAESNLVKRDKPIPGWETYHFGLEEEQWSPQKFKQVKTHTDEKGQANITTLVDRVPQTSHLLQLETTVTVFEMGGRAQTAKEITPFWHQPYAIGISPRFKEGVVPFHTKAVFDVIALTSEGKLQSLPSLRYTLFTEEHDYIWFRSGGDWQYEIVVRDKAVANGVLTLAENRPTSLTLPVDTGRYRLEVLDEKAGIVSSIRFCAGWHQTQEAPDRPDLLEIKSTPIESGKAKVNVNSPFEGELFLAVAGDNFKPLETRRIKKGTSTVELSLKGIDISPQSYLLATVFRPGDPKNAQMPSRAMGVAWLQDEKSTIASKIDFKIKTPQAIKSNQPLQVEVEIPSKAGTPLNMAVAVVDEAILSLVGYKTPDPFAHFFGQKQLPYEVRDSYGLLINPYGTRPGSFEVGGDSFSSRALAELSARPYKIISLFSGVIDATGQKTIQVPFELPEFSGKLRVMVIMWDKTSVGSNQAHVIVRDEIDMYLALPRFLAPGDVATIPLILRNVDAKEETYQVSLEANGKTQRQTIHLKKDQERKIPFKQTFSDPGVKKIQVKLKGDKGFTLSRSFDITSRQKTQSLSLAHYGILEPGQHLILDNALLSNFEPKNSRVVLTLGGVPELGRQELIQELQTYPYHCLEQTTSRLLANAYDLTNKTCSKETDDCAKAFIPGFNQLSALQKFDGSFALWSTNAGTEPWLSLYVADVLNIIEQKEIAVPLAMTTSLHQWIREIQQRGIHHVSDISLVAYAHYLTAKQGKETLRELQFFADNHEKHIVLRQDCAFIAAAFAHFGEASLASKWFDKAIQNNTTGDNERRMFGSVLRDKALLVALMGETTINHPKLNQLAHELVACARDVKYFSTQEKAWLIRASEALTQHQKNYEVVLNDKTYQKETTLKEHFKAGDLKNPKRLTNQGKSPLYYTLRVVGEPIDTTLVPQKGFEIKREIYQLNGESATLSGLKSGERYVVVIKGKRLQDTLHHVMVVDLLPAGFEIETAKLSDSVLEQYFPWLGKLTQASRIEGRDDRFVAAFDSQKTDFTAAYVVRAVTKGQFTYPAVYVESMYQPEQFKYGSQERIEITQE